MPEPELDSAEDRELLGELRRAVLARGRGALADPLELADPVLARYRITGRIGEGGMGIVYEAEQESPRRTVALKVLRAGAASERMLRRFAYEAEILGRLDHAHIAKVLESGTYDTGHGPQPWLAMELVRGETLARWLDARAPPLRARLELFLAICDAVHHAHQKGVIHRDLKPANILVDAQGEPKVLDFGVARALDSRELAATAWTLPGQLLGTLAYMSPEQIAGDHEAVDVRSDVYALGVILYEMLAGRPPLDVADQPLAEAARILASVDPPRLGARAPECRGDLETIAAKALEKERERRYGSAAALADDVARTLRHEPIAARPPSGLYQARKFARRHRALVLSCAAAFLSLAAGLVAAAWQAARARDAEADARAALAEAETGARRARAAAAFLQSVLEQASPGLAPGEEPSMRAVLEQAAGRVEAELGADPAVEAQVRAGVGRAYIGLSDASRAREHLERALSLGEEAFGPEAPELAHALAGLASLGVLMGDVPAVERCVARLRPMAAARPDLPALEGELAVALEELGSVLYETARYAEAAAPIEEAIRLHARGEGQGGVNGAVAKQSLALVRSALQDRAGALALFRESFETLQRACGERHPQTAAARDLLGGQLLRNGAFDEAEVHLRAALDVLRERYGERSTRVANCLQNLSQIDRVRGDREAAAAHLRQAVDSLRLVHGDAHPRTAQAKLLLAQVLVERGELTEAERFLREIQDFYADRPDREGPVAAGALRFQGSVLAGTGRPEEAAAAFQEGLAFHLRLYPAHDLRVVDLRDAYGALLVEQERFEEAERELAAAWEALSAGTSGPPSASARVRGHLAALYDAWEKPEEAARFRDP